MKLTIRLVTEHKMNYILPPKATPKATFIAKANCFGFSKTIP